MDRWTRQVQVDVEANASGAVAGDVVALTALWDRVAHTLDSTVAAPIDGAMVGLRRAIADGDLAAALTAAAALQASVEAA